MTQNRIINVYNVCYLLNTSLSKNNEYGSLKYYRLGKRYQEFLEEDARINKFSKNSAVLEVLEQLGTMRKVIGGGIKLNSETKEIEYSDIWVQVTKRFDEKSGRDIWEDKEIPRLDMRMAPNFPHLLIDKPIFPKFCKNCGVQFYTTKNNQIFCFPGCRIDYQNKRRLKISEKLKKCPICGEFYHGRADKTTCGKSACRKKYYREFGKIRN